MPKKIENKDIFLQSLINVKPIKKSNKNYKKVKPLIKKNLKKIQLKKNEDFTIESENIYQKPNKKIFKIETSILDKKLKRGKIPIDKKIDFHGMTLDQAKKRFFLTINDCFYSKKRCILFITGKGINKNNFSKINTKLYKGKIRNDFLNWINQKEVVSKILNVTPADAAHGGDGAFFLYLRKNKT